MPYNTRTEDYNLCEAIVFAFVLVMIHGAGFYLIFKSAFYWIYYKQCSCDELWYGLICRCFGDILFKYYNKLFLLD